MHVRSTLALPVALLALAATATSARADGFEASVGDRLSDNAVVVAAKPVTITSTGFLANADKGCQPADTANLPVTVTFTPPAVAKVTAPLTQTLTMPADPANDDVLNASWPVTIPKSGATSANITWDLTTKAGKDCSSSQDFRLIAVPKSPTIKVLSAYRYNRSTLSLAFLVRFPGFRPPKLGDDNLATAFDTFLELYHQKDDDGGEGEYGPLSLFTPRAPNVRATSTSGIGNDGVGCITFHTAKALRSFGYALHFTWNKEIGALPIRRNGRVRVTARPTTAADRSCDGQNKLAFGG